MAACVCALCGRGAPASAVDHVEASTGVSIVVCEGCLAQLEELSDDEALAPMPWNLHFDASDALGAAEGS